MESLVPRHDVGNDNQFGPSSNHRFDFTLLFEQAILSIIPSSILLLSTSYLVPRLCRQAVKTTRHPIEILKLVNIHYLIHFHLKTAPLILYTIDTHPILCCRSVSSPCPCIHPWSEYKRQHLSPLRSSVLHRLYCNCRSVNHQPQALCQAFIRSISLFAILCPFRCSANSHFVSHLQHSFCHRHVCEPRL